MRRRGPILAKAFSEQRHRHLTDDRHSSPATLHRTALLDLDALTSQLLYKNQADVEPAHDRR